jgi:hypothetical protein
MQLSFSNLVAASVLGVGLLTLAATDEILAASKAKEAARYAKDLKTSKDPKTKVVALNELGKFGQVSKILVEDAYKDMLAALGDGNPAIRAAAATAVGQAYLAAEDPKTIATTLAKMMKDDGDESVRIGAINGLAAMRDAARPQLEEIRAVIVAEVEAAKKKDPKNMNPQTNVSRAGDEAVRYITQ